MCNGVGRTASKEGMNHFVGVEYRTLNIEHSILKFSSVDLVPRVSFGTPLWKLLLQTQSFKLVMDRSFVRLDGSSG
jgi:hypothetical protein